MQLTVLALVPGLSFRDFLRLILQALEQFDFVLVEVIEEIFLVWVDCGKLLYCVVFSIDCLWLTIVVMSLRDVSTLHLADLV